MPVNKPRKPRRPRAPAPFQDARRGIEAVNNLAKQYNRALKDAERIKREDERAKGRAGVGAARVSRVPTAEDTFYQDELPFPADDPGHEQLDLFGPDYSEHRTPVALDQWDTIQTPDDEDAPDVTDVFGEADETPTATEYYAPTRSINPPRPRTREMSYNRQNRVLRVVYRSGGTYHYFNVPSTIWYRIRQVKSPGRFIDRNIKGQYAYERVTL